MGERPDRSVFQPEFNRSLRVERAPADRTDELGALSAPPEPVAASEGSR